MAKEEGAAAAPAAPAATERPAGRAVARKAAEQQFWAAARGRRRKRRAGRTFLIVAGIALGASLAAAGTMYGPALLGIVAPAPPAAASVAAPAAAAESAVARGPQLLTGPAEAIDGATLTVAGQTIKLQGVQSPPVSLVCRSSALEYPCGDVARRVLNDFAGGAPVACTPASGDAAAAGVSVVAVCRNRRGWDLAALQVETGWAIIQGGSDASPYRAEEARARANAAGLWPGFAKPEQWTQTAAR